MGDSTRPTPAGEPMSGADILVHSLIRHGVEVVFAYPGGRLNREQTLAAFVDFARLTRDTRVYVRRVILDGDDVAVEWQFATTDRQTGKRSAVSDGIIGRIVDGKFILWKEYFDLSVSALQADGTLQLEEGEEPFPWPLPVSL